MNQNTGYVLCQVPDHEKEGETVIASKLKYMKQKLRALEYICVCVWFQNTFVCEYIFVFKSVPLIKLILQLGSFDCQMLRGNYSTHFDEEEHLSEYEHLACQ